MRTSSSLAGAKAPPIPQIYSFSKVRLSKITLVRNLFSNSSPNLRYLVVDGREFLFSDYRSQRPYVLYMRINAKAAKREKDGLRASDPYLYYPSSALTKKAVRRPEDRSPWSAVPFQELSAFRNITCQVRDGVSDVVIGHSQYGQLSYRAVYPFIMPALS